EIADCALAHGPRQRTIDPFSFATAQQEPPDEIRSGQIVVASDGDERPAEVMGHGLEEACLPASGWTFQQNRQALTVGRLEDAFFVPNRHVVRSGRTNRVRTAVKLRSLITVHDDTCRRTSAERRAERNSGPIT